MIKVIASIENSTCSRFSRENEGYLTAIGKFINIPQLCINERTLVGKLMAKNTARIALVNPPPPVGAFVHYQSPLIGIAYIAAVLRRADMMLP